MKLHALEEALPVINNSIEWERVNEIIAFFTGHLQEHFEMEENLISILRMNNHECSNDELQLLDEILQEHKMLTANFNQLSIVAEAYAGSNDRGIREIFTALTCDIIDKLLAHAGKEDQVLYPLARKIVSVEQLLEIGRKFAGEMGGEGLLN
jgi:hemerythrin-like domain-containing protein